MKKIIGLVASLALLTGVLTGCAQTTEDNTSASETTLSSTQESTSEATDETDIPEAANEVDEKEAAWPRTIEDALGNQVTLEAKPERVAILDFGFMESMFALNTTPIASTYAMRTLNGFGTLQTYALDSQVEELGEATAPNLEMLVELEPDLILMTAEDEHLDMELYEAASQIATVVTFDSFDWKEQLKAFAECLGEEETAEEFIENIEALIVESREDLAAYSDKTVALLFERSSSKGDFYITGSTESPIWFDTDEGLGLTPPNNYPETGEVVSLEGLASLDPDYIFLFGSLGSEAENYAQIYLSEETQSSSVWQSLTAVKNEHVYYLDVAVRAAGPLSIKLGIETIVESMAE